jgi:hypothetical protein
MSQPKYETARTLAGEALHALKTKGKDRASGQEMLDWIGKKRKPQLKLVEKSWGSFLTRMLDDPESSVVREPGRYGYMLREPDPPQPVDPEETATPIEPEIASPVRVQREQRLYSLLVEWLQAKEYQAEDTSLFRRGGAWGNPDVVGLRCFEGIGAALHLELVSIEAKVADSNWRRVFFEAVSHKRFADRAYFAFAFGSNEPSVAKLPEFHELRDYGEKYRVGILVVFMEPSAHEALCASDSEAVPTFSLEDVRVEEVWPAVSDPVPPHTRERFMQDVLDIRTIHKLHSFGR